MRRKLIDLTNEEKTELNDYGGLIFGDGTCIINSPEQAQAAHLIFDRQKDEDLEPA